MNEVLNGKTVLVHLAAQVDLVYNHGGSREHLDYTLIGKTVNVAARLCGIANLSIVVSPALCDAAADVAGAAFRSKRPVEIRGLREPIFIYDLARRALLA